MAYFLKKTKNKKGLYLQIYESFYDPERGHTAHKSYTYTYHCQHYRLFPLSSVSSMPIKSSYFS